MWVEKHGPSYRIRDLVAGTKVTLKSGYPTKTAAKNAMVGLRADQLRGESLAPRGDRMLLRDWIAIWQPSWEASLKPSTHHSETGRVRNHILPLLGHLAMGKVDGLVVQAWVDKLAAGVKNPAWTDGDPPSKRWLRKPLSPKTIRNCHGILFTIMDRAAGPTYRLIASNPCTGTILPAPVHREMRFLSDPEIGRLIAALPMHWRPLVLLLVATGLRWGEATGLRIGSVDLLAKVPILRVTRAMHEKSGTAEIVFTEPKTRHARRTVSFTKMVAEALAALVVDRDRDELLFTAVRGGAVRTRNFRRIWLKACERAGLAGLRIHDLRHTHAALLISAGRSLTAIQRRLGHSSIAITSDLYGHLREEVDEGIIAAIEEALAGVDMEAMNEELQAELAGVDG